MRHNLSAAETISATAMERGLRDQAKTASSLKLELQRLLDELDCRVDMDYCTDGGRLREGFDNAIYYCDIPGQITCEQMHQQFSSELDRAREKVVTRHNAISARNNEISAQLANQRDATIAGSREGVPCRDKNGCLALARKTGGIEGATILRFACQDFLQDAESCELLGWSLFTGSWAKDGIYGDVDEGLAVLRRACQMGSELACVKVKEIPGYFDLGRKRADIAKKNQRFYEVLKRRVGDAAPAPPAHTLVYTRRKSKTQRTLAETRSAHEGRSAIRPGQPATAGVSADPGKIAAHVAKMQSHADSCLKGDKESCEAVLFAMVTNGTNANDWSSDQKRPLVDSACNVKVVGACAEKALYVKGPSARSEKKKILDSARKNLGTACDNGDAASCGALGRVLRSMDKNATDEILLRLRQGCRGGSIVACTYLGYYVEAPDDLRRPSSVSACEQGSALACWNLGQDLAKLGPAIGGERGKKIVNEATEFTRRACHLGYNGRCGSAPARPFKKGVPYYPDPRIVETRRKRLMQRMLDCGEGSLDACQDLAIDRIDERIGDDIARLARGRGFNLGSASSKACKAGAAYLCAWNWDKSRNTPQQIEYGQESIEALQPLCSGADPVACGLIGWIYDRGKFVHTDPDRKFQDVKKERAAEHFESSCNSGIGWACYYLGQYHNAPYNRKWYDLDKARSLFERGCEQDSALACHQAARHYRENAKDEEKAALFFRRAHELGIEPK